MTPQQPVRIGIIADGPPAEALHQALARLGVEPGPAAGGWLADAPNVAAFRLRLGRSVPIIAVADRRWNLAPETVAACDAVLVPRLTDESEWQTVAAQAARLVVSVARGEVRPTTAAVHLPLAVGDAGPFAELDLFADDQAAMPLVLANGIVLGGHGEVKDLGVTVVVVTDFDIALARNLADDLAAAVWERRAAFTGVVLGREALERRRPMLPFEPAEWSGETFGE